MIAPRGVSSLACEAKSGQALNNYVGARDKTMGKKQRVAPDKRYAPDPPSQDDKLKRKQYEAKLDELHMELVKMQYWIKATGRKVVLLFEGRDAAGKGGAIKSVTEPLNPRGCRIVALGTPSDTEKS